MGRRAADGAGEDVPRQDGPGELRPPGAPADADTGSDAARPGGRALGRALGMTLASALVWGVAHLAAGRRVAGALLMGLFAALVAGGVVAAVDFPHQLRRLALRPDWLAGTVAALIVLALVWAAVVVRSYQVVRPHGVRRGPRVLAGALVMVLALGVCAPPLWAARDAYTLRDTIGTIFRGDARAPARPIDTADPWKDRPRVDILLLGGDGAGDRTGIRTDSMTVASIDTKTGDTVLLSLPRNLQDFPVIPRLRSRWPDGFTGVGAPGDQGLLNELFQDAEDDPSLVPGYGKGRRGPELVREEISYLIGQPVDYYILVNLFGFADLVDAMGGVNVHIAHDIPYGGPEDGSAPTGVLKAGDRTLSGKQALWYGRSRTASSDFVRMGRQKCLMKDIAEQADPQRVLTRFQQLAAAAKKTISTNIPADLLPALVRLSATMKQGARVSSLMFVPPRFHVYRPDVPAIRDAAARAIAQSEQAAGDAAPSPGVSAGPSAAGAATPPETPGGPPPAKAAAGSGRPAAPSASSSASSDSSGSPGGPAPSAPASSQDPAAALSAVCGG